MASYLEAPLLGGGEPPEWSSARRWAVLGAFAFNAVCNGYIAMDFSTSEDLELRVLGLQKGDAGENDLKWLYSSIYIVVPVCQILVAYPLSRYNWGTMLGGIFFTVLCAWLRFWAVASHSYTLGLLSSIFTGVSAAVIVSSYAVVPEHWFAPSQRGLATAIGVQANYLGWAFGVLLPLYVDSVESMRTFAMWQALIVSLALPLFLGGYRSPPADAHGYTEALEGVKAEMTPLQSVSYLLRSPVYIVHAVCCGALGGISFAITGVQDLILGDSCGEGSLDLPSSQTTWTNFAFVSVGVIAGLVIGQSVKTDKEHRVALLGLTLLSADSLAMLSFLATPAVFTHFGKDTTYVLLLVCMGLTGVGLLGFISVALRMAVKLGGPVSEVYSAGGLELLLQLFTALFAQVLNCDVQFIPCAVSTAAIFVVLLVVHARPGAMYGSVDPVPPRQRDSAVPSY